MIPVLPSPRKIPVIPRPRHGELSGSYLARVARANRTDLRSFLSLLGSIPSALASKNPDLAAMVLTLNEAAFIRLLAYTGLDGDQLVRAIPSLAPRAVSPPGEPPAIRLSFVKTLAADCPGCRLRWRSACSHNLATARLGSTPGVHRAGGRLREPALGRSCDPSPGPMPSPLLPASPHRTRPRRRAVPADYADLRSAATRHPRGGQVGPSPQRPGLGHTASFGSHPEGDPIHRHHRRLRALRT